LKRLELLVEVAPRVSRVAVIGPGGVGGPPTDEARSVARALGVELLSIPVSFETSSREGYEVAFGRLHVEGTDAVLIRTGGGTNEFSPLIARLAELDGLPGVASTRPFVTSG